MFTCVFCKGKLLQWNTGKTYPAEHRMVIVMSLLPLYCRGLMFYSCYLYLFTYTFVQESNMISASDDVRVI